MTRVIFDLISQAFVMQMCKYDLIEMTEYIFNVISNQHSVTESNEQAWLLYCANTIKTMTTH